MARFTLTIDCNNAAFDDEPFYEIGRILSDAGQRIIDGTRPMSGKLHDVNGNRVGEYALSEKS